MSAPPRGSGWRERGVFASIQMRVLVALGLSVVLGLSLASVLLAAYQRATRATLHRAYSETLSLMAADVDEGLDEASTFAVSLVTDPDFQLRIDELNRETDRYRRAVKADALVTKLASRTYLSYVTALYVVDRTGQIVPGRYDYPAIGDFIGQDEVRGFQDSDLAFAWRHTPSSTAHFVLMRRVRRVSELALDDLGALVVVLDKERFVRSVFRRRFGASLDIGILQGETVVYASRPELASALTGDGALVRGGYETVVLGGIPYFASSLEPSGSGLRYVCLVPSSSLFQGITVLNRMALAAFVALAALLLLASARVARGVAEPVIHLAREMRKIENEDFARAGLDLRGTLRRDEIGVLYREFRVMLDRIDALITEGYRKQLQVKDARLRTLQAQINPHFLYNTLESINWMAQLNDQETIASMVQALGDLLRAAINDKRLVVTAGQEVALLRQYLLIQTLRYGDRLDVDIAVGNGAAALGVPKLVLQPLVENAIKYGLEAATGICRIAVSAVVSADRLVLRVEDNGPGMESAFAARLASGEVEPRGSGVGIKNIRERIVELYGHEARLTVQSAPGKGTAVSIELPARSADEQG